MTGALTAWNLIAKCFEFSCANGWKGELCDECITYPGCQHGICDDAPFTCHCLPNWGGAFCDQGKLSVNIWAWPFLWTLYEQNGIQNLTAKIKWNNLTEEQKNSEYICSSCCIQLLFRPTKWMVFTYLNQVGISILHFLWLGSNQSTSLLLCSFWSDWWRFFLGITSNHHLDLIRTTSSGQALDRF